MVENLREDWEIQNVMIAFEAGDASVSVADAGWRARGERPGRVAIDGPQRKKKRRCGSAPRSS